MTKNKYISINCQGKEVSFDSDDTLDNRQSCIYINNQLQLPTSRSTASELANVFLGPADKNGKRNGGLDFSKFDDWRFELEGNPFLDGEMEIEYLVDGLEDSPIEAFSFSGIIGVYVFVLRVNVLSGTVIVLTTLETDKSKKDDNEFMHFDELKAGDGEKIIAKFNEMIADRGQSHVNNVLADTFAKVKM